jgi:hypothetical protein
MITERVRPLSYGYLAPSVAFIQAVAAAYYFSALAPSAPGAPASRLEPVVEVMHATRQVASPTLAVSEMTKNLKDAGLPISAIAEAARVERKTVYSWLDGAAVRESHTARIAQIHKGLLPDTRRDLRDIYRMWATPLADGTTLKSLLAAEDLDVPTIRAAVASLMPNAEALADRRRRMAAAEGVNGFAEGLEVATTL